MDDASITVAEAVETQLASVLPVHAVSMMGTGWRQGDGAASGPREWKRSSGGGRIKIVESVDEAAAK